MDQKTKSESVEKVRLFCKEVLKLSEQETYQVINRLRYELYHKKRKIREKEILNHESEQEVKNWEKI